MALQENYDKVWVVESDTIPPEDALEKLLSVDADVVGGLYALRHGNPTPNVQRWGENLRGIGGAMKWSEVKENYGKTIQVSGVCTGCVVIDHKCLEGFSFNQDFQRPPDGAFMEHCFHNKFKQMARLDVMCGHVKPDGEILYPQQFLN